MASEAEENQKGLSCIAVYLPENGIRAETVPVSGETREEVLQQAFNFRPSGKRLSRIVPANDPHRNLWESGKGWLPTLEEQSRQGWR